MTIATVYRQATDHDTSKGVIMWKTGDGSTWDASPTQIAADGTYDCRDPNICKKSNGDLLVNYFIYDHVGETHLEDGVRVIPSTDGGSSWGSIVSLDTAFTGTAATCGPIIELADTTLRMSIYGKDLGDTYRSVKILASSDDFANFTEVLIADGEADGRDYSEGNLLPLENGDIICLIRTSSAIYYSISTDSGATWSAPANKFVGTGCPHARLLSNGDIVCCYRSTAGGQKAALRTSGNGGITWSSEYIFDTSSYVSMMYATPLEIDGALGIVYAVELTTNDADLLYKSLDLLSLP